MLYHLSESWSSRSVIVGRLASFVVWLLWMLGSLNVCLVNDVCMDSHWFMCLLLAVIVAMCPYSRRGLSNVNFEKANHCGI